MIQYHKIFLFQALVCLIGSVSSSPEAEADPILFDGGLPGQNPIVADPSLSAALLGNPLQSTLGNPLTAARRSPLLDLRNPVHLQRNPLTDSRRTDALLLSSAYSNALR